MRCLSMLNSRFKLSVCKYRLATLLILYTCNLFFFVTFFAFTSNTEHSMFDIHEFVLSVYCLPYKPPGGGQLRAIPHRPEDGLIGLSSKIIFMLSNLYIEVW